MMRAIGLCIVLLLPAGVTATELSVCFDFGCKSRQAVALSAVDWGEIEQAFGAVRSGPGERDGIARAVAAFERVIGRRTPTGQDRGGNIDGSGLPGQMDCIDESLNTTGYLQALQDRGLLGWHRVVEREYRAPWLLDQHWTAVIEQRDTGVRYVVDSWFLDNGKQPYVQAVSDWKRKARMPPNPDAPQ